jgi:predicted MFS family arabinose efflux permease
VLTFLGALPHSLRGPVLAVLSPELVPAALARRAISASSSAYNLARLAGPAIGGGLVTTVGVAAAFAVNTVALAAILVAILLIPAAQVRTTAAKGGTRGGLRAGVAATWRSLLLRTMLASAVTFFVFVGPLEQVMPVVAADHGDGAEFIGLLLAGIALGGLIGNPIAARLQARQVNEVRVLGGALIASGLLLVVLAVSRNLWLDLAVVTLIGAAWEIIWLVQNTAIHYRSPEGISGEVMGLLYMVVSVSVALGSVVTGWAFATIGVEASLLASAALLIVLGSIPAVTGHRILARQ